MTTDTSILRHRLISIVDDDDDIVMHFHDALGTFEGFTIFTFTDPLMALEHFKLNKEKYVLVISDLRMPGLTGMELIKEIKRINQFVRTILMTAFETTGDLFQEYSKKELINGFLLKPIRLED